MTLGRICLFFMLLMASSAFNGLVTAGSLPPLGWLPEMHKE
jgi:hypothetical protein